MQYELVIFDIDGTIADRESGDLLSGVEEYFSLLSMARNRPEIAFATNQGGAACRDAGWLWSEEYPSLEEIEQRYTAVAQQFGATLYMSLLYKVKKTGALIAPKGVSPDDPRLSPSWRKPQPGMLLSAMQKVGASPLDTLMVGDRPEDKAAATAAGCNFIWAQKFFARGWERGENYDLLR